MLETIEKLEEIINNYENAPYSQYNIGYYFIRELRKAVQELKELDREYFPENYEDNY